MSKLRILPILSVLLVAACERGGERDDDAAADKLGLEETAQHTTDLLSPVRATGLVLIEHAQAAAQQASRADIRQFGQIVAADHRALVSALDSAAAGRGATLNETPSARDLAHTVRMAHSGTETLQPAEFDMAFIRAQVESHRQLLDRLDHELIPNATSADLRNLLSEIRATSDAHLMRARQLLGDLLGEPVEPPPAGTTQSAPLPPPDTVPPPDTIPPVADAIRMSVDAP